MHGIFYRFGGDSVPILLKITIISLNVLRNCRSNRDGLVVHFKVRLLETNLIGCSVSFPVGTHLAAMYFARLSRHSYPRDDHWREILDPPLMIFCHATSKSSGLWPPFTATRLLQNVHFSKKVRSFETLNPWPWPWPWKSWHWTKTSQLINAWMSSIMCEKYQADRVT